MIPMPTHAEPVVVVTADCLATLRSMPDRSVDGVVTSPPYNTLTCVGPNGPSGKYKDCSFWKTVKERGYEDDVPEEEYQKSVRSVVRECLRVSRGLVWVNHKTRYRDGEAVHPLDFMPFPVYAEVIWDRGSGIALNCKRFVPSHELIYAFGSPHFWDDSVNTLMSVWRIPFHRETGGRGHPCPFPLELPRRCVRASIPPGGVVMDPYAGSGTTGHAALVEGRTAVLVEKRDDYCDIIRRRVRQVLARDSLIPMTPKIDKRGLFPDVDDSVWKRRPGDDSKREDRLGR